MHFLDLVQKIYIICRTCHPQFMQWSFEGAYRISGIHILQDIIASSNTNILKRCLAMHCSVNWDVQLVRGCIRVSWSWTSVTFINIYLINSGSISFSYLYIHKSTAYKYNFFSFSILSSQYKWSDDVRRGTPAIILTILFCKTYSSWRWVWYAFPKICIQ